MEQMYSTRRPIDTQLFQINEYPDRICSGAYNSARCTRIKPYLSSINFSTYEDLYGRKKEKAHHQTHPSLVILPMRKQRPICLRGLDTAINKDNHLTCSDSTSTSARRHLYNRMKFVLNRDKCKTNLRPMRLCANDNRELIERLNSTLHMVRKIPNPSIQSPQMNIYKKLFSYHNEKKLSRYIIK